ncbi:MAG: hypothetical protein IJ265_13690 [Oscillospiraceae bacterium]|nr:hypothetical protein [Oscillospiraceae bacterium]MBQ8012597.1 hypothetical protein [Oscillospiraceae bacterium]
MMTAAGLCICGCLLALVLRQYQKPQAVLLGLAVCCILLLMILPQIQEILDAASVFFSVSGMNAEYFGILCKAVGITYLTQLGMDFCRDCGENAICTAVELFGRISLISLSMPLFSVLVQTVLEVIG